MEGISDIKLIRTDTTLDLSRKAEKGMVIHPTNTAYMGALERVQEAS